MEIALIKAKVDNLKEEYSQAIQSELDLTKERTDIITMLDINDGLRKKSIISNSITKKVLSLLILVSLSVSTILAAALLVTIASIYFKEKRKNHIKKDNLFYDKMGYLPNVFLLVKSQKGLKSDFDFINGQLYIAKEEKQRLLSQLQIIFEYCLEIYPCDRTKAIETGEVIDNIGNLLGYDEAPFMYEQNSRVKK